jgi:hypothetical protein
LGLKESGIAVIHSITTPTVPRFITENATSVSMEYSFEVSLCARLERETEWVLGRQLGAAVVNPGSRVVDVVGVVPGSKFEERARITSETIPAAAIEADVGVGRPRRPRQAFDCHPDRAASIAERAIECGFFERVRRDGHDHVRQTTRYPDDWFGELVGIENKPDLGTPGDLQRQLRVDASLALFDRVILVTATHVTRAHLNRLPEGVGVWQFDPESGERTVVRDPSPLAVTEPGVEVRDQHPAETEIEIVSADAKRRRRRRIAERAYGKGWRPASYPACTHCAPDGEGLPYCEAFERVVDPGNDCGETCERREATAPPEVDVASLRDERTPWVAEPEGTARRQAGLDRFG